MLLAPGEIDLLTAFIAVVCIAVGAGASGAVNMWYDRDIDSVMERTMNRPLPAGRLKPPVALWLGTTLSLVSVGVMGVWVNLMSAGLLAVTIAFYVFVYTIWLKRRTPQNIVIGGASGALPPMIGWAAVTNDISIGSLTLFAIIFMWTPPHFWALSLYRSGDYEKAGVPMMPVVSGIEETKRQILIYTLLLFPFTLVPAFVGMTSLTGGLIIGALGIWFIRHALLVLKSEIRRTARHVPLFYPLSIPGLRRASCRSCAANGGCVNSSPMTAYLQLEEKFHTIATLEDAAGMLHWDAATMMPPGSAEDRHEQLAVLTTIRHDLLSSSETGELLAAALDTDDLNNWQRANLREMERRYIHATAVETPLVTALSKASNICETRWRRARADNDFGVLKPLLADVLSLSRDAAQSKAERLSCTPYEALMDQFTPGLRTDMVDTLFDRLGRELPDLLSEILEHQASQPEALAPAGPFPLDQQRALGTRLMAVVGFDFETGRLDESLHPFSGGTPDDLRITTRYEADDFMTGLMGVLHETGHALYEKNLPSRLAAPASGRGARHGYS